MAVIGIDVNDQTSAALAFVHKSGVTYPVATEPALDSTVIAYDLPGLPATFFLDAHHRIVKRVYGAVTQAELTSGTALINERASEAEPDVDPHQDRSTRRPAPARRVAGP